MERHQGLCLLLSQAIGNRAVDITELCHFVSSHIRVHGIHVRLGGI